jgi:hypothetical protein
MCSGKRAEMAVTADNPEPDQRRRAGRTRPRAAAWVAVPLGSLNVAFSLLSLLLAGLAGWSLSRYLEQYTLPAAFLAVSYSIVGALIASLRPRNPLGWIFLAVGFSQSLEQFAGTYVEYALVANPGANPGSSLPGGALMSWLSAFTWVPGLSLAITFVPLLFPDGRLPSRRWRPVAWLCTVPLAIFVVLQVYLWPYRGQIPLEQRTPKLSGLIGALSDLLFPLMLVCAFACVSSLMFRYRRAAGTERQQIKWFAYAAASFLTAFVASVYLPFGPITYVPAVLAAPLVPVAVGIAILRYRLYDIDLLINRTLVYGSLTVTLALIYFGGVTATQELFGALTGEEQQSQLAVVVSTLVIAALFMPLRRRIQSFIDRRFYRRKYDAAKTLEAFSAKLRDETDLDALSEDLVGVVRATLQPTHVSLWLHPDPAMKEKTQAAIRASGHHE